MKRFVVFLFLFLLILSVKTTLAFEYTIEPSLSLSEEYNDNIFLDHTDRVDDFITYISPAIDFSVFSATSELKIGYAPTFSFYKSNNDLNETAHRFSLNGNFTLSNRLKFSIIDTFVRSSELSDIRTIETIGPIHERITLQYNTLSGNFSYQLRENLSYILGVSYQNTDYKEGGPDLSEVKTYSGNMGLNYKRSERTTFLVNAQYTKYDYRPESDATQQDYTLGVTYRFTPTFTSLIKGGITVVEIEETDGSDTLFNGGIDLTKTFERGEALLSLRQSAIGGTEGKPLRYRSAIVRVSKTFIEKWSVSLHASYSNYKSIGTNNENIDEALFKAGLTYNFTPWAKLRPILTLSYGYFDSNDKINDRNDYYNNIILFTLKLGYSTQETRK
jgi:hypothetical protein